MAEINVNGDKKQFKVVLRGKAIHNVPLSFHEDCTETTLNCYDSRYIWEGIYSADPLHCLSDGVIDRTFTEGMSLCVDHVKISEGTAEGIEFDSDVIFKINPGYTFDKPCTNDGYVAILECNITCTFSLELPDASDFDLSKLAIKYDEETDIDGELSYDGKTIDADFAIEATKLTGYTDGIEKYEHCYEAPVPLVELVDKYQGAVLEISLMVERDEFGEFADDEAEELYNDNHWEYKIKGHQLVNEWTEERFDINNLDETCLEGEMARMLSNTLELDCWSHLESGYDVEACLYETDEGGNYIDMVCSCIIPEAWL